jgi:hypothetical protein
MDHHIPVIYQHPVGMFLTFRAYGLNPEVPQFSLDIIGYCPDLGSAFAGTYYKIIRDDRQLFELQNYSIFCLFVECCVCCL